MNKSNSIINSIRARLIIFLVLISIVPITVIGVISITKASDALEQREYMQLESVGILKTELITEYINDMFASLDVFATTEDAHHMLEILVNYHDREVNLSTGNFDAKSESYNKIHAQIKPWLGMFTKAFDFDDMFLLCGEHGHVMYTDNRNKELGTSLKTGEYSDTHLAKLWNIIKETGKPALVDFEFYEPAGTADAFLGAPIKDNIGRIKAIVAVELSTDKISTIMQEAHGLGETGESYIVGKDHLMRSISKSNKESTILSTKVDTESVTLGFERKTGVHAVKNYQGKSTFCYYKFIDLESMYGTDFNWVLIAEIKEEEALAPATLLRNNIIIITVAIAVIALIVSILIFNFFSKPINTLTEVASKAKVGNIDFDIPVYKTKELKMLAESFISVRNLIKEKTQQAKQISEGDLTVNVTPLSEEDEMGKAFQIMVKSLNNQISEISEVLATLDSSNSQLVLTISELSSSATETATTVSEVTTTIEEVKQTAELAAQKAKNVSTMAQKSVQYSEDGIKATEDSVKGMHHIQEQVKQIAETIIKLSEQSQMIGEITSVVNDLAEQSNLLAVNASIEAVKAGESGKGFGVVAQEIRTLADQSKQATNQIKKILSDVQKAIGTTVMATEQGDKAVDSGMQLAEASGDSISMLAENISEATTASTQIAASSHQQFIGIEQLTVAIENIKQAASQNANGAKQAEDAVTNIKSIVISLDALIKRYKTV